MIQTWGDQNEGQKMQYVVKVKMFWQVLFVFWINISVPRLISLTLLHSSAVENHWFEFRLSLFTTVEPGLSKHGNHRLPNIIQKSTLLIVKHFKQPCWHVHRIGKLDCTGHLHQVCMCLFACLEYASGLETSLNVSGVSISFTWTSSHILR